MFYWSRGSVVVMPLISLTIDQTLCTMYIRLCDVCSWFVEVVHMLLLCMWYSVACYDQSHYAVLVHMLTCLAYAPAQACPSILCWYYRYVYWIIFILLSKLWKVGKCTASCCHAIHSLLLIPIGWKNLHCQLLQWFLLWRWGVVLSSTNHLINLMTTAS